ncbi:MAG: hypothetical protein EXR72_22295 [Myxococcales bacterium]|nr:hypothetical protein [Myxococcales bacterium]
MSYENVLVEVDGPVAIVTLNRPKALNALNKATMEELLAIFEGFSENEEVRAAVLTGAGEKAFVAGADITEMVAMGADEALSFAARGHDLGDVLAQIPQVVIAAVNGFALGGGCELAMACDFIYAAEHAKFGQPEVNLGVIPGFGGTQRLARLVGVARAMEMVVTGETLGAAEALRIGLVNRVLPAADLLAGARATANTIAAKGPFAVAAAKRAVRATQEMALADGNRFEMQAFASCFGTLDQKEGMSAFKEKRSPKFQGR